MYSRRTLSSIGIATAFLSISVELLMFYSLFLQFDRLLSGLKPSELVYSDIIFYLVITAMSVWVHELIEWVLELGDRLEQRGEAVWKRKPGRKKRLTKRPNS